MSNVKKIIASMLLVLVSATYLSQGQVWADDTHPPIVGQYGVAIDAVTGQVLYDKNADDKAYPASTTKILTSIILDEKAKDNQVLTVSANAAGQECSCFGLKPGEKITKKNALFGMLLVSANDLAVTIAENIGGSVKVFAKMMNAEAQKLGLKNSHFVTPNGLHDPDHYTTPHDMALIMREALKHPEVLQALSTQTYDVHTSLGDKVVSNPSKVHTQGPQAHVIAGKTGFTDEAGNTLVEYLKEGDKQVIAVVMKTTLTDEYSDIQTMANYAFAHMTTKMIAKKGHVVKQVTINGQKVNLVAQNDITISVGTNDTSKLDTQVAVVNTKGKEVPKGKVVANLKVVQNGQTLMEAPLVANQTIKATSSIGQLAKGLSRPNGIVVILIGVLLSLIVYFGLAVYMNVQNRKKGTRKYN